MQCFSCFSWRKALSTCLLTAVVLLTGCGPHVTTDYDVSYDFTGLDVYAWSALPTNTAKDPLVDNDLVYGRITDAVDRQLAARGFRLAEENEGADFFVGFHVKAEEKFNLTSFDSWHPYASCWPHCYRHDYLFHNHHNDIELWQYKQGVFMIDVIEPATERLIWRGATSKRLSDGSPESRTEYINSIIDAIFTQFPAGIDPQ